MAGGRSEGRKGQLVDGRFELLERLGSGGMGTVWRAHDTALRREVALKEVRPHDPAVVPEGSKASRLLRARVLREARALARLSHPHVVTIHQLVDDGPYPWLVMELLPGRSLQDATADGPLDPGTAARLGGQVLGALRAAHAAGIQHRDVKPANILLRADGDAVLTDFGIAALQDSTSLTATGELIGSPEYIAPERIRGTADGPAADLWSLGMTLYVTSEGHSPLRRATTLATLAAVLDEPVPPPVRSGELAPVLSALLVRDTAARPDAGSLARMLEDAAAGRPASAELPTRTAAVPPSPFEPPHPPPPPPAGDTPRETPHSPTAVTTAPPATGRGPRRTALIAGAAVLAVGLIASGTYVLARPGGGADAGAQDGPTASRTAGDGPGRSGSPGRSRTPTPSEPGSPTARPPSPPASGAPVPGDRRTNTWIAQLASVPKSDGVPARRKQLAELSRTVDGVLWLDSGKFASLRPGYWVLYRPGPVAGGSGTFPHGRAAVRWCASEDRTSANRCVGRYLSHDRADRVYLCSPGKNRSTGRCTRLD